MPDISLLQREYYGPEEEESRIPSVVSTVSLTVLLVVVAAYVGLYLYRQVLEGKAENIKVTTEALKGKDTDKELTDVRAVGRYVRSLRVLRESHTRPFLMFTELERMTLRAITYRNGTFSVLDGKIVLSGETDNARLLVRQMEVFEDEKKAGKLSEFSLGTMGYGDEKRISFALTLSLPEYKEKDK